MEGMTRSKGSPFSSTSVSLGIIFRKRTNESGKSVDQQQRNRILALTSLMNVMDTDSLNI